MKPKIVTLCGSTRFKEEFELVNREMTLQGIIVLAPGVFAHADPNFTIDEKQKTQLDELHKRKIDISDAIYVINKGQYIGASTRSEIEYAVAHNKRIYYME